MRTTGISVRSIATQRASVVQPAKDSAASEIRYTTPTLSDTRRSEAPRFGPTTALKSRHSLAASTNSPFGRPPRQRRRASGCSWQRCRRRPRRRQWSAQLSLPACPPACLPASGFRGRRGGPPSEGRTYLASDGSSLLTTKLTPASLTRRNTIPSVRRRRRGERRKRADRPCAGLRANTPAVTHLRGTRGASAPHAQIAAPRELALLSRRTTTQHGNHRVRSRSARTVETRGPRTTRERSGEAAEIQAWIDGRASPRRVARREASHLASAR